jgi:hypothetical protein
MENAAIITYLTAHLLEFVSLGGNSRRPTRVWLIEGMDGEITRTFVEPRDMDNSRGGQAVPVGITRVELMLQRDAAVAYVGGFGLSDVEAGTVVDTVLRTGGPTN